MFLGVEETNIIQCEGKRMKTRRLKKRKGSFRAHEQEQSKSSRQEFDLQVSYRRLYWYQFLQASLPLPPSLVVSADSHPNISSLYSPIPSDSISESPVSDSVRKQVSEFCSMKRYGILRVVIGQNLHVRQQLKKHRQS